MKKISTVIKNSVVAHTNKLSKEECEMLAQEIISHLKDQAESVETLFDMDLVEEDQIQAVPVAKLR
jgi:hypothetical protein